MTMILVIMRLVRVGSFAQHTHTHTVIQIQIQIPKTNTNDGDDEVGPRMVSIGSLQRRQTAAGLKITRTTKKGQKYQLTKWKES